MVSNYCAHNKVIHYWKIELFPSNEKGYGTRHEMVFKGKTIEGAIKAAKKHCANFKLKDEKGEWFQVYAFSKVLYECNPWGREVK